MKIKKIYKIFYNILLNIYRFRHAFRNRYKEFGFFDMFKLLVLNLLNKRDKNIYLKGIWLFVKPNFFVITTLIEIFNIELYKNLKDLDCVLDLWAYIWESSIYMSRHNKKIIAFEPSVEKFKLLEKNIEQYSNIEWYNFAVVGNKNIRELTFYERDSFDFCSSNISEKKLDKKVTVPCKDISSVLNQYTFDGLKMDIEWWEFPIIQELLKMEVFTFKKWIIEFHFVWDDKCEKIKIYNDFYNYLIKNNFTVRLFDNDNQDIPNLEYKSIWIKDNLKYFNLEFYNN